MSIAQAAAEPRPQRPAQEGAAEIKALHFSVRLGGARVLIHLSAGAPFGWADLTRAAVEKSDALRQLAQAAHAAGACHLSIRMTANGFEAGHPCPVH